MIYMVECALTARQSEADWNRWYHSMKPPHVLPTVPGISSTQRFKGLNHNPPAYLALYNVSSADVMSSAAYRNAGGGVFQTENWKPMITFWHRDLFEGEAPEVPANHIFLLLDRPEPAGSPLDIRFTWLASSGLDNTTPFRGIAAIDVKQAERLPLDSIAGLRTFRPVIPLVTRERPLPEGWTL